MKQKGFCFISMLLICGSILAQPKVPVFTADSIESGNSKDIFTNFFQLAFNNFTGKNREFNFSSSPYAIMLKRNPDLSIDTNYKKYRSLRKLNISLGVRLDSSFYFNGFASGIKYALINKTDITASRIFAERAKSNGVNKERNTLDSLLSEYFREKFKPFPSDTNSKEYKAAIVFKDNVTNFSGDKPFASLKDVEFKKVVRQIIKENGLNKINDIFDNKADSSLKQIDVARFEALKNSMKNNLLWTIGISDTTYKDKFQFANISLVTEISKGLFDPEAGDNNIEFTAKSVYNFLNDTLINGRNLKREIFTTEAGFNWIIRDRSTDKSFFETKFSGTYYHNFASIYNGEKRDSLTLNATLRFRLTDDIWIPFEVKYNPKSGNVFGFFNIKANFTGLGKLLKQPGKN